MYTNHIHYCANALKSIIQYVADSAVHTQNKSSHRCAKAYNTSQLPYRIDLPILIKKIMLKIRILTTFYAGHMERNTRKLTTITKFNNDGDYYCDTQDHCDTQECKDPQYNPHYSLR
jgi:hypothetical protein